MTCPACGHAVPVGARFCPSCGHALLATRGDERRIVTVLFADLVEFTGLAEGLDPEQVKNLVDGCFQQLVVEVMSFGGRVDKIVGDAIVALFGAPVAHEDDAERAVRTALRMQSVLAVHTAPLAVDIRMRIGVNTGEVLVGALRAGGDYTAMGDVVNIAARLQTAAPPGGVLVGPATHAATEQVIRYHPQGSIHMRGREEPVEVWQAEEAIAPPGRRPRRVRTPLIGRETEAALLRDGIRLAMTRNRPLLAVVEGEGGVGKSRLVEEAVRASMTALGLTVLHGHCVPYGEANPWWPIAVAVRHQLQIDFDAPTDDVRQSLEIDVGEILPRAAPAESLRIVDGLLHLFGRPTPLDGIDPQRAREELVRSVLALVHGLAGRGPLLLAVSDVHWADQHVLELLERLVDHLASMPFALVTTSRPAEDERWPPPRGRHNTLYLRLDALDPASAETLACAILGAEVDATLRHQVLERSGGNPLFLEELATLVHNSGMVGELPDTLRGLMAARLDRLSPPERAMLDNAAVLGPSGTWQGLVRFAQAMGQRAEPSTLASLADADLLEVDSGRWRFRSESVREVAYQTLTKAARAQRHVGVAAGMEEWGDKDEGAAAQIGYHYATAAALVRELGSVRHVPDDVAARAVTWLIRAAEHATDRMVPAAAERYSTEALELLGTHDPTDPDRRRLLLLRGGARSELRDLDGARSDASAVVDGAQRAGDLASVAEARTLLGEIELQAGHVEQSVRMLADAVALWREVGDARGLAEAQRAWGLTCIFTGEFAEAERHLAEADEVFLAEGDRKGQAWVDQHRAWVSFVQGDIEKADQRLHTAAATFAEMGDRGGLSWANGLLAFVRFHQGRFAEAEALASGVADDAEDMGEQWGAAMMKVVLASLRLWVGRTEEALLLALEARTAFREMGDRYGDVNAIVPLSRALVAEGRGTEAHRVLEECRSAAAPYGMEAYIAAIVAGTSVHLGDGERAVSAARTAIEEGQAVGAVPYDAMVALGLGLLQIGQVEDACRELEMALSERPHLPYGQSGLALALVASGRAQEALETAALVSDGPGATYLDRTTGLVAAGLALAQLGDGPASEVTLAEAASVADGTGDLVAQAIARLAAAEAKAVLDAPDVDAARADAAVALARLDMGAGGWITALRLAAWGGEPVGAATQF